MLRSMGSSLEYGVKLDPKFGRSQLTLKITAIAPWTDHHPTAARDLRCILWFVKSR